MEILRVPFEQVTQFSEKDIAYATDHPALEPFKKYPVTLGRIRKNIPRQKSGPHRSSNAS